MILLHGVGWFLIIKLLYCYFFIRTWDGQGTGPWEMPLQFYCCTPFLWWFSCGRHFV